MNKKRFFLSTVLAMLLCLALLSGCGSTAKPDAAETFSETDGTVSDAAPEAEPGDADNADDADSAEKNEMLQRYTAALNSHDPDEAVMYVNGEAITWSDYFSWIFSIASQLEENYAVTDWDTAVPALEGFLENPTYGAYVTTYAETNAIQSVLVEQKSRELNAGLTDEQAQLLKDDVDAFIEQNGEDAFRAYLSESFITEDYFDRQCALSLIYDNLHDELFGVNGEKLSDEDAVNYLEDQGFLHAKHILFSTMDEDGNAMSEEDAAAVRKKAEEVLAILQAVPADELDETFDRLMQEHSEDPGSVSYPNGYYFQSGEMVASFEQTARELEVNAISGLVESNYGIHILYRPAVNADDLMGYDSNYMSYTPRAYASDALFNEMIYDWYDAADISYTELYQSLSIGELLK